MFKQQYFWPSRNDMLFGLLNSQRCLRTWIEDRNLVGNIFARLFENWNVISELYQRACWILRDGHHKINEHMAISHVSAFSLNEKTSDPILRKCYWSQKSSFNVIIDLNNKYLTCWIFTFNYSHTRTLIKMLSFPQKKDIINVNTEFEMLLLPCTWVTVLVAQ